MHHPGPLLPANLLLTSLALVLTGCGPPTEVQFDAPRKVSREQRPTTWDVPTRERLGIRDMAAPTKEAAQGSESTPGQRWTGTTPDGWEELPPQPERFRELNWRVAGNRDTECYLSVAVGGGVAGNMTRWYTQQFGIAEVPNAETLTTVEIAGRQGRLVDLAGTFNGKPGIGMLLAFFAEADKVTSLKFTGPEAIVKQNHEQFLAVAKSLRVETAPRTTGNAPRNAAANDASTDEKAWTGTTPDGWEELPPQPERFRELNWRLAGNRDTECYLSVAVGGGVAGNMTRWYTQQFGIAEVPNAETLTTVEIAGRQGRLVDLAGTFNGKPGIGMLLAFFAEADKVTSLKFTGPEAIVKQNREQFLAVAKSLRMEASQAKQPPRPEQAAGTTSGSELPAGHPGAGTAGGTAGFTATVPSGWTVKAPSHRALHYTFGSEGEVYLSQLGGTLRPTLDIWRGELGLGAMSDAEYQALSKVKMLGGEGTLLDVAGDFRSMSGKEIAAARLLVAALVDGGSITFVKLVGKATEVEAQREGLLQFLGSLRRTP